MSEDAQLFHISKMFFTISFVSFSMVIKRFEELRGGSNLHLAIHQHLAVGLNLAPM